jgi:hypothetical protein
MDISRYLYVSAFERYFLHVHNSSIPLIRECRARTASRNACQREAAMGAIAVKTTRACNAAGLRGQVRPDGSYLVRK